MEDIRLGDGVQLQSGGPRMTVNSVTDGKAYCKWLANGEQQQEMYQIAMLSTASPHCSGGRSHFGTHTVQNCLCDPYTRSSSSHHQVTGRSTPRMVLPYQQTPFGAACLTRSVATSRRTGPHDLAKYRIVSEAGILLSPNRGFTNPSRSSPSRVKIRWQQR